MSSLGNNVKFGMPLLLVSFVVFSLALYGGSKIVEESKPPAAATEEAGSDTGPSTPGGPVEVTIVAKDIKFDKRSITASAGSDVTVNFNNQDAGVQHNLAFYSNKAAAQTFFKGELFAGPATKTEKFTAPTTAGTYFFRCDVHPDTMNGSFIVK